MTEANKKSEELTMATTIVSAYVSKNRVLPNELPELIATVHQALKENGAQDQAAKSLEPAVPVKKSVKPDYIVCLEDGRKLKMLKRHLRTSFDMSPEEYRAKWRLPEDYPMVAPKYAAKRSELAKKIGLGTTRKSKTKKRKAARS